MAEQQTMHARHAVTANMAQCVMKIGDDRVNFMQAIELEATAKKNKKDVAILGRMQKGNKTVGLKYEGKCKFYLNTAIFIEQVEKLQENGEDLYFDIIVENEDKTAGNGRQTVVLKGCNIDEATVAKFTAEEDFLTDEVSFTFESFEVLKAFDPLEGTKA